MPSARVRSSSVRRRGRKHPSVCSQGSLRGDGIRPQGGRKFCIYDSADGPQDSMLGEISQSPKSKSCLAPLHKVLGGLKLTGRESRAVVGRAGAGGHEEA